MNDEIKEINIKMPGQILDYVDTKEHLLNLFNYITNLQQENKKLKILNKTAEIYLRKHTIYYIEDEIECVKPSEYFNIQLPVDILNGNTKGIEIIVEKAKKEIEGDYRK